eukprot:CAMPEP_0113953900 /NCGR_PEP_ID=MMETSP0011_2-20120614/113_1 /TAXON_ID=101924 /ORGANISM="Rhodosorus marinus" /LENGTH=224 /DNA_ID=CAMNT_0000962687 /DNA_START=494 /DNA_END=1168 /DNA_ORIENTATION=- /assembly_acc=CAM_ASM_000156
MKGFVIFSIVLAACALASSVQIDTSSRAHHKACKGKAIYKVVVKYVWTGMTHPGAYPPDGHFSPTTVCSHGDGYTMWTPGGFATKGVQDVAETGNNKALLKELKAQLGRNVYWYDASKGPTPDGTEKVVFLIKLDGYRSMSSGISMVAPSPDWYTGWDNVELCDSKGKWVKKYKGNLSVWDAGTDSGKKFTSKDKKTKPYDKIVSILSTTFGGVPVGTVTFTRK